MGLGYVEFFFDACGRNRDFLLYSAAKHPGPHRKAGLRAAFNDPVAEPWGRNEP